MSDHSNTQITIAIDAMGGDAGLEATIPGLAMVHAREPDIRFVLFGDRDAVQKALDRHSVLKPVTEIVHSEKIVRGDEKPSAALRNGKGSSMRMAIEAVKDGKAQAAVSSGNTGALMAMALTVLRPLPGIHRPALASIFPAMTGSTIMLDLGANVLVDAETLVQFAVLGSVFAKAHKNVSMPTVGLLNVGTEDTKGPDHVRAAATILANVDFPGKYHGFVEGTDITEGTVDVVVSDGYAGNIALKAAEGVGKFAGSFFKRSVKSDPLAILGCVLAFFALRKIKRKIDPRLYNGGVFLGLNGICVKSHGGTDALGFSSAVILAIELARHGYTKAVAEEINRLMEQENLLSHGIYDN